MSTTANSIIYMDITLLDCDHRPIGQMKHGLLLLHHLHAATGRRHADRMTHPLTIHLQPLSILSRKHLLQVDVYILDIYKAYV